MRRIILSVSAFFDPLDECHFWRFGFGVEDRLLSELGLVDLPDLLEFGNDCARIGCAFVHGYAHQFSLLNLTFVNA